VMNVAHTEFDAFVILQKPVSAVSKRLVAVSLRSQYGSIVSNKIYRDKWKVAEQMNPSSLQVGLSLPSQQWQRIRNSLQRTPRVQ